MTFSDGRSRAAPNLGLFFINQNYEIYLRSGHNA